MIETRTIQFLVNELRRWSLPPQIDAEDIAQSAFVAMLDAEKRGKKIPNPTGWLLTTSMNLKRDALRTREKEPNSGLKIDPKSSEDSRSTRRIDFDNSPAWNSMTFNQQYTIIEHVMFERPVAEIAKELNVNRKTAASWVRRLPRRLASDPIFRAMAT